MICLRKLSVIFLGARSLECAPKKLERTPASAPQIQKERAPLMLCLYKIQMFTPGRGNKFLFATLGWGEYSRGVTIRVFYGI